ncbi:MAG: acyl carrier protein [Enterocloster aldenensis]|uniref:acyl carrier protein n=1 Tax=Enterocloster aldenensis TaxID=358742 RepID=UPI0025A3E5FB|nr:acyl carrier protein [Enterocloster aldenensis]
MKKQDDYNAIFIKVFSAKAKDLNEDFSILNIDKWDSVAHMQLISEIEDTFDIMFDTDDIIGFSSYEKGLEILKKYDICF